MALVGALGASATVMATRPTIATASPTESPLSTARAWEAVRVEGNGLPWLLGATEPELTLVACRAACQVIPWQLDERDPSGRFVLDQGVEPSADDPPGVLDGNDEVLFMAGDAAARTTAAALEPFAATTTVEIEIVDPRTAQRAWVYLLRVASPAPRAAATYVHYDPAADRLTGARVALGFERGTPRFVALGGDSGSNLAGNLLDRMKIRATARFLWGLIRVTRTEDDIETQPVAWRAGPIRILRRQRLWVPLALGFRTPIFATETSFYRDGGELSVSLRLNFPPRLLFAGVTIRVALDFRDLVGWQIEVPSSSGDRLPISGHMTPDKLALSRQPGEWFALHGRDITLVQALMMGPSLSTVQRRLFYREGLEISDPPESVPGEMPAIGYTLSDWGGVSSGAHWFAAHSYVLPAECDVAEFIETLHQPLRVTARPFAEGPDVPPDL